MSISGSRLPAIVAITGGAFARESGFAPFDAALFDATAMPGGISLEDVVTRDGFERDRAKVHGFYNLRRREVLAAVPNAAHDALAVLDAVRRREVFIVTRNIDDFHERAGSQAVIHTHGELLKGRCQICTNVSERYDDIKAESVCPVCGNAGHLRPHIVWIGEEPLGMAKAYEAVAQCTLLLVAGIPSHTEPVRGLVADARRAGARTVEFSPEPAPESDDGAIFVERFAGPIAETLPAYVKMLIADSAIR